jgi:hypothetical protein
MIGMLYPRSLIVRLMRGGRSFEKPEFYVRAAREAGEEMWFFSLADVDWRAGTARGWNGVDPVWKTRPIPAVILNRTRTTRASARRGISRLRRLGKLVCNERNVVSKLAIHRILAKDPSLLPYLPETASLSAESVAALLSRSANVFLKPSRASVGNGIIRISRAGANTVAEVNRLGRTERRRIDVRRVSSLVKGKGRGYLVQQGISLMKYRGRPVDFRVSIQRGPDGGWQCTGMVGKVARKKAIVTNLHCGGTSIRAEALFREWGWNESEVRAKVADLGVRIASALERGLPPIADLGLDIALDEQGHPWFIESNFRDLRITFRNAGDRQTWISTFETPVRYAASLLRSAEGGEAACGT